MTALVSPRYSDMLFPRSCTCNPVCLDPSHEPDVLVVMRTEGGRVVEMRGATVEEKRRHRIETLEWRAAMHEREAMTAREEIAALGVESDGR